MSTRQMLDGNAAATEALCLARVSVVSAYPITPQSPVAEMLAERVANGGLRARYVRVESEHSALSCAIGAQLTGVRAATATSSVGLALMHEVLGVASGCRVPIVMPVINRALVSPWSLWCDHQDAMAERDSGWLQFYARDVQQALDLLLVAYRVAEHEDVLTPAMVCLDGFFVSHSAQPVWVPEPEEADAFLPPYRPRNLVLDPDHPMFVNDLTPPEEFSEMRFQQQVGFSRALEIIPEILHEFEDRFGRRLKMVETDSCEDAEAILVTMGSMSGTARHVAHRLRAEGCRVGVAELAVFRPFPAADVRRAAAGTKAVGVLERTAGLGAACGPVGLEVDHALAGAGSHVLDYVAGLGGRDITERMLEGVFRELLEISAGRRHVPSAPWIDTRADAMELRPVPEGV